MKNGMFTACFLLCCNLLMAQVTMLTPGQPAPDIQLKNINDQMVSFKKYPDAKGFILIFTCNTCPYSRAYELKMIALNSQFAASGYPVLAINPNDPATSPGDSFTQMKTHAKASKFTFPYLYDQGQQATLAYGPKSTPHVFVITKTAAGNVIAYSGAIDNGAADTDPDKINYVASAVTALLSNQQPAVTVTKAIGCRISWKTPKVQ